MGGKLNARIVPTKIVLFVQDRKNPAEAGFLRFGLRKGINPVEPTLLEEPV